MAINYDIAETLVFFLVVALIDDFDETLPLVEERLASFSLMVAKQQEQQSPGIQPELSNDTVLDRNLQKGAGQVVLSFAWRPSHNTLGHTKSIVSF